MIDVVQKLWGFCHTLRHDGVGYTEYIEQITYLLFIKMADEKGIDLPKGCTWSALSAKSGTDLIDTYPDMLRTLGKQPGILGQIFAGAQPRITKPASFKQLITSLDTIDWTSLPVDVKAEAYEGLLEKAASEGKKGAGGYFTPRPLIRSIVRCIKPDPRAHKEFKICDPACGVGGFLVAANDWLAQQNKKEKKSLTRAEASRVRNSTYYGQDISEQPRRLALMNLYLHLGEPNITLGDTLYTGKHRPSVRSKTRASKKAAVYSKGDKPLKEAFEKRTRIYAPYKGEVYRALVFSTGTIKYDGQLYNSASAAGTAVRKGKPTNGWRFWKYKDKQGNFVSIDNLRAKKSGSHPHSIQQGGQPGPPVLGVSSLQV